MPYRNMTLDELARHIGMDAREVRRLANRGILPGRQVRGEWRFNRAQMLDWLQREMHSLGEKHVRNLEQAMSGGQETATVGSLLAAEAVDMNLPAKVAISYEGIEYFAEHAAPDFRIEYLIFVSNHLGPNKIGVYGFGTYLGPLPAEGEAAKPATAAAPLPTDGGGE